MLYHYAARTDDAAVTDGYALTYRYAAPQPAVFADGNRRATLYGLAALEIVGGVIGGKKLAVGPHLGVAPDGDQSAVEHRAVVVDKHVLAQLDAVGKKVW